MRDMISNFKRLIVNIKYFDYGMRFRISNGLRSLWSCDSREKGVFHSFDVDINVSSKVGFKAFSLYSISNLIKYTKEQFVVVKHVVYMSTPIDRLTNSYAVIQ